MKTLTQYTRGILLAAALLSLLNIVMVSAASADRRDEGRREEIRREEEERRRIAEAHRFHEHHPVYAPAPVVYVPPPSPGISIVLPIVIR